jgi:3-methylcrotonyl-CoA carboxylase alpha subunit
MARNFDSVLVANRGEIADRILRTCSAMGLRTVAVFSDADADAPHVRRADEAVRIGPPPASESYLSVERVLEAARLTGAQAVHPGYGFLSENAAFAKAVEAAGLVWIGPPPSAIEAMGSKIEAKRVAQEVGVPIVPGYMGQDQSDEAMLREAQRVGLPLLVKASAGGGGKGMRIVRALDDLSAALAASKREAKNAFGDDALMLERYIEEPRHVEVQILGDHHGNVVHLFERECSIQRRYQKIIEESPSTALDEGLRREMGEAAVALARKIGYANAGTVEFIVAPTGEFYFLEVNTRLQVEHPVTEALTGLDLVRLQVQVAQGCPLPWGQAEVPRRGAALECRLYAESVEGGFLPSTGRLVGWSVPDGVRADAGVAEGDEVSVFYDPMLAKLITWGEDREEARLKMTRALRQLVALGVETNRAFLLDVLEHPAYIAGRLSTHFIQRHFPQGWAPKVTPADLQRAAAWAALAGWVARERTRAPLPSVRSGLRLNRFCDQSVSFEVVGGEVIEVRYRDLGRGKVRLEVAGQAPEVWTWLGQEGAVARAEDGRGLRAKAWVKREGERWFVQVGGVALGLRELPRFPSRADERPQGACVAPMPGKVVAVRVAAGQPVAQGEVLMILEAMKMEHPVQAPKDGVVAEV